MRNGTKTGTSKYSSTRKLSRINDNCAIFTHCSRSPSSLEHPNKLKVDKNNNKTKEIELRKPKATRHLILIRHGQYELTGTTDEQRILTKLGRTQAQYTGKRLRELGLPYTTMIRSTMARAQETANIIAESLPEVISAASDLAHIFSVVYRCPPGIAIWLEKARPFHPNRPSATGNRKCT